MIIKIGIVRDRKIVATKWFSAHEHVLVPIFSPSDVETITRAMAAGGPSSLSVFSPQCFKGGNIGDVTTWIPQDIAKYLGGLPPGANPLAGRQLVGSEVGLDVKKT